MRYFLQLTNSKDEKEYFTCFFLSSSSHSCPISPWHSKTKWARYLFYLAFEEFIFISLERQTHRALQDFNQAFPHRMPDAHPGPCLACLFVCFNKAITSGVAFFSFKGIFFDIGVQMFNLFLVCIFLCMCVFTYIHIYPSLNLKLSGYNKWLLNPILSLIFEFIPVVRNAMRQPVQAVAENLKSPKQQQIKSISHATIQRALKFHDLCYKSCLQVLAVFLLKIQDYSVCHLTLKLQQTRCEVQVVADLLQQHKHLTHHPSHLLGR